MDDIPEDKRFSFTWQQLMPTAPLPLPPPLVEPVTQLPATDFVSPIISDAFDVPARNLKERQRNYTHEARQGSVEEEVVVSWPPMQHNMHGMQLGIQHAMPCAMRSQLTALLIGPVRPPGSLAGLAVTRQRFACWGPALMHQLRSAQGGHVAVQATRELFRAVRAEMRRTFDMMDQSDKRLHIKEIMECCSAVGVNPRRHHSMAVQLALGAEVDDRMGTRGHFWFRDVQFELELYLALSDHLLVSNSLVFMAASYLLQRLIVWHMASGYSMEFDPQLVTNLIREIDALGLPFPAKTKIHYPQLANWVEEHQFCWGPDCSYPTNWGPALHLSFGTLNGVPHVVPATEAEVSSVTSKSWHSRDGPMTPAGAVASLSSASPPASPPPEEVVLPPAAPTPTPPSRHTRVGSVPVSLRTRSLVGSLLHRVAHHRNRALGVALFATRRIPRAVVVLRFRAVAVSLEVWARTRSQRGQRPDSGIFDTATERMLFDPTFNGCSMRFPAWYYLNHSRRRASMRVRCRGGLVAFTTRRTVEAGQMLTFDYGVVELDFNEAPLA